MPVITREHAPLSIQACAFVYWIETLQVMYLWQINFLFFYNFTTINIFFAEFNGLIVSDLEDRRR